MKENEYIFKGDGLGGEVFCFSFQKGITREKKREFSPQTEGIEIWVSWRNLPYCAVEKS